MLEEQKRNALRSMKKPRDEEIPLLLDQLKLDQEYALSRYAVGAIQPLCTWLTYHFQVCVTAQRFSPRSYSLERMHSWSTHARCGLFAVFLDP